MNAPKFTPGPWSAGKPFYHSGERQKVTPIEAHDRDRVGGTWLVAWCHHNAVPSKEVAPNARLIAAAPELFAVAQSVVDGYYDEDGCNWKAIAHAAQDALAKAVQP